MGARREWVLILGLMILGREERLEGGLVDGGGGKCGLGDEPPSMRECVDEDGPAEEEEADAMAFVSRPVLPLSRGLLAFPFSQDTSEAVAGASRLLWEDDRANTDLYASGRGSLGGEASGNQMKQEKRTVRASTCLREGGNPRGHSCSPRMALMLHFFNSP
jgi:hypothetical protein